MVALYAVGKIQDTVRFTNNGNKATLISLPQNEGAENFYKEALDLGFVAADLGATGPDGEFRLAPEVRNRAIGKALRLHGPLVRIPGRV